MTRTERMVTGVPGRALALGLTGVALLAVWTGCVAPVLSWHSDRAGQLRQREAVLAHMAQLAAGLPALRQAAKAGTGTDLAPAATVPGESDPVAGALLQERLQALANQSGATLRSVETLPSEATGVLHRIGLRVNLAIPWPTTVKLLQEVEHASPPMFVDELRVHSVVGTATSTAPLQVSFAVYAFRSAQ